jgi:hypothetical protein
VTTTRGTGADYDARRAWQDPRVVWLIAPALLLVIVGAVVAVLSGSTAANAVAIFMIGVGCVVGVSLVFWRIGRSEDRERER